MIVSKGTRSYVDNTAMPGVLYEYRVAAENGSGYYGARRSAYAKATGKSRDELVVEQIRAYLKVSFRKSLSTQ